MVAPDDDAPEVRPPRLTDLVARCRRLNEQHAHEVVIGGVSIPLASMMRRYIAPRKRR